ncbi:hypothetical protein M9980_14155 [Sphingomonas donggukensis]|uniref:Uncharacterized protein n=1 Tax=Sphingomonas donggukensis TaxID=2949093 RepID=A0ABY4TTB8_9SPHN|nr:hypothetical protein [Sphingomonas donggukensis]URW75641.1 hypothetical protein M9980_14155 [Sphingomonas donggukensis]
MRRAAILLALATPGVVGAQQAPFLRAIGLPDIAPVAALEGYRERYRIFVRPSFDQRHIVSIDRDRSGRTTLELVVLSDRQADYARNPVLLRERHRVPQREQKAFAAVLRAAQLDARTRDHSGLTDEFGRPLPPSPIPPAPDPLDGTSVTIEHRTAAGYAIVMRHEYRLDPALRALVEKTLALTGRRFDRSMGYALRPRVGD